MKKLSIFLLVFSMILSSVTPAHSWPWSRNRRPLPPKTATIQGRVTDSITNQAISAATVRAGSYRASTNASGKYVIKNIKVWFWGRIYRVKAEADGYYTSSRWVYVRRGRTRTLNFGLRPKKPLILVKITSPEDNSYIRGTSLDVSVSWQGRAGIIDLYLDDSLAGSYRTWRWWHRSGNHTFKIDLSSQQDGEHKLKAIAYRSHRRRGYKAESKEITFILDNTLPVISDISPENNTLINNNQPEISAILSDATSGIDKETIILKLDAVEVTASCDEITGKLSYTPETILEDGTHTVSIEVKDKVGNEASASSTFRVETDTMPPSITDLSPKEASIIYYTTPTISAKYSDDKSGVDETTVKILVNAVDVTASSTITEEGISYTPAEELTQGGITVNIEVKDNAGNLATKEFSFEIKILTAEEALELVKINHDKIQDMKATLEGKSTYKSQPYGKGVYADYWYKYPDKKKTRYYTSSARDEVESISILADTALHYINPSKNIKQTVDILEGKGVTKQDLANANPIDNLDSFINANDVIRISNDKGLYLIKATPKEESPHYNKIFLYIDTSHSLLQKTELYKDNNLKQIIEISSYEGFEDGIYVASETKKIPVLEDDNGDTSLDFITTVTYSNIEINTGIPDSEFDLEQQ